MRHELKFLVDLPLFLFVSLHLGAQGWNVVFDCGPGHLLSDEHAHHLVYAHYYKVQEWMFFMPNLECFVSISS